MTDHTTPERRADFKRPDGPIIAAMGVLIFGAALVCAGMAVVMLRDPDLQTLIFLALGLVGALVLGAGFLNAWRVPLLTILPDRLVVPTFFGTREIKLGPGGRVGEMLATPAHGGRRTGAIEGNKFVHFFAMDGSGEVVELLALHRASPLVGEIRRAFAEVAGLKLQTLQRDPKARRPRPDVSQWTVPESGAPER
jgi:hypothetical protein